VRQLTAHKVGIVSADLAEKPTVALAVLVAQLAMDVLGQRWKKGLAWVSRSRMNTHSNMPPILWAAKPIKP
ncbi:MAG: hypothetical protein AB7E12_13890, partial [Burkholderiaceae bacterium]